MSTIAKVLAVKVAICYREPAFASVLPMQSRIWYDNVVSVLPGIWGYLGRAALQHPMLRNLIIGLNESLNPGDWAHIVYRKARMAQVIDDCIVLGADGIINLGCGFDTNTSSEGIRILHVDRKSVLSIRAKMRDRYPEMADDRIEENAIADLDSIDDIIERFSDQHGLHNLIIQCEGFLEYLDDREIARLLSTLAISASARFLVCTQFDFSRLGAIRAQIQYGALSLLGESVGKKRRLDDWNRLFESISYQEIEIHQTEQSQTLQAQFPAACIKVYEFLR